MECGGLVIKLSATHKESMLAITSLKAEYRFTYYDQRHITGSDVDNMKEAKALFLSTI